MSYIQCSSIIQFFFLEKVFTACLHQLEAFLSFFSYVTLLFLEEVVVTCLFVLGESALSQLTVGESAFSQLIGIFFLFRLVLSLLYYHSPIVILFASLSGLQLHQMVSLFIFHHTKSHLTSLCLKWIGSPAGSGGSMPGGTQGVVQIPPSTGWSSTIKRNPSAKFWVPYI